MIKCQLCGRELKNNQALGVHLHYSHKEITLSQYYRKFIGKETDGYCISCGKECNLITLTIGFHTYCSHYCQANSSITKEKAVKTKFQHFGEGNYFPAESKMKIGNANRLNKEERIKKARKTYKEKTGYDWVSKNPEIKEKIKNGNIEKYGNACSLHGINQEKTESIFLEKYGYKSAVQSEEVLNKIKATNLERRGCEMPWGSKEVILKRRQNYFEKTGYYSPAQNPEIRKKTKKKITYKNIKFDSYWELAYYIWLEDNNVSVIREPTPIKYMFEDKELRYFPDFLVEGQLVEIKNPILLEEMKKPETVANAKFKCMQENNIKIITDCSEYLNYVKEKYGKDYLKQFKNK